jgi:hypothetical protein
LLSGAKQHNRRFLTWEEVLSTVVHLSALVSLPEEMDIDAGGQEGQKRQVLAFDGGLRSTFSQSDWLDEHVVCTFRALPTLSAGVGPGCKKKDEPTDL